MIRSLVRRYGTLTVTAGMTLASMAFATLLLIVLDLLFKGHVPAIDLLIVNIIPGIIAPVMTIGFIRLVHDLDRAEERLKTLAREDPLTDTFNRRHFLALARVEWARAQRYELPLSLIIIDVDNFKAVNDSYGHAVGDEVLVNLGAILRTSLRSSDILARYGGEEFVLLLPETKPDEATRVAERIRRSVEKAPHDVFAGATVSAGVSAALGKMEDLDELLRTADEALYSAKQSGCNLVAAKIPEQSPGTS